MVDSGKSKALVDWVNALGVSDCFESLKQLQDGVHFCKIIQLIDKDQKIELEFAEDRLKIVVNFLEGHFQVSMIGKIDWSLILSRADEFEIAKICLLLFCVGILGENNHLFLEPAMKLEMNTQVEIREMIESVVRPEPENRFQELDSSFSRILLKSCDPVMTLTRPQMSSTPQAQESVQPSANNSILKTPTQTNLHFTLARGSHETPVFSNSIQACGNASSILGRFYSPQVAAHTSACMSPVQQLVSSPGMSNKIKMQQKEQRIKRLMRELNAERHTRSELEVEIQERDRQINKQDLSINDLQQQLQAVKREFMTIQANGESSMMEQGHVVIDGLKRRTSELVKESRELKERNCFLEAKNSELCEKNNSLCEQVEKLAAFRRDCSQYQTTLTQTENYVSELNTALRDKARMVAALLETNKALESDLRRTQELHKQQQMEWRRTLEISVQNESGECLQEVMEKQLTEQIELLQGSLVTEQGLKAQLNEQIDLLKSSVETEQNYKIEWQQKAEGLNSEVQALMSQFEGQKSEWEARAVTLNNELKAVRYSAQTEKNQWQQMSENLHREMQNIKEMADQERQRLQSKISGMEDDLSSARDENSNIEKCLEMQMHEKNGLQQRFAELQNQLLDVKKNTELQVGKLQRDITSLRQENTDLVTDVAKEQLANSNFEQEIGSLRNELDSMNLQLRTSQEACQSLQSELNVVEQDKCHRETVVAQKESELTDWQSRCRSLEQELSSVRESSESQISAFTEQLNDAKNKNTKLQNIVDSIQGKMEEMEKVLRASKQTHDQINEDLKKKLQMTEEEKSKLQDALSNYSKKYQNLSVDHEKFSEKVMMLDTALRQKQEETSNQCQEYQQKLDNMAQQLKTEKEEKLKFKEELKDTKSGMKKVSSELLLAEDTLREKEKMACNLQATLNETQNNVTYQQEQFGADLEASRCREQDLQSQLVQAQAGLSEFRNNLEQLMQDLEQNGKDLSSAKNREIKLNNELSASQDLSQQLERKLNQTQIDLKQVQETHDQKMSILEDHLKTEKSKSLQLEQQVRNEMREAEQRQQSLEEEKVILNERVIQESRKLQDTETKLKFLEQNLDEVKQSSSMEKDDLRKEFNSLQSLKQQLQAQVEIASNTVTQLQTQLEQSTVRENEFKEQLMTEKKQVSEIEKSIAQVVSSSEAEKCQLSKELLSYKDQVSVKLSEIEALRSEVVAASEEGSTKDLMLANLEKLLCDERIAAQNRVDEMQQEYANLQQKCNEAETRLKCMEQSVLEVKQVSHLQQDDLQKELVSLQSMKQELQAEVEIANGSLSQMQSQLSSANAKSADLQLKITEAQENCNQLEKQLEQTTTAGKVVQSQLKQEIDLLTTQKSRDQCQLEELLVQLKSAHEQTEFKENLLQQLNEQMSTGEQTSISRISQLEQECSSFQNKFQEAETCLKVMEQNMEEARLLADDKQDVLKNEILELQTAKQQLQAQVEITYNSTAQLQNQVDQVNLKEKELRQQLSIAKQNMVDLQQSSEHNKVEGEQRQQHLQQENAQLMEKVSRECSLNEQLKSDLETMKASATSKVEELQCQMQMEQETSSTKVNQMITEHSALQSQLHESVAQVQDFKAHLSVVDGSKNHLEAEVANRTQQVTFLEGELDMLRSQLAEKSKELICSLEATKALQSQFQQADTQSSSFERAMKLAKETSELAKEEFKSQLDMMTKEQEDFAKQKEEELNHMLEQLSASQKKVQQLEAELQELRLRMLKSEGEKQESKTLMYEREKDLQGCIDELKVSKEDQQREMQHFKARVNSLEEQVIKAGEKVACLSGEHNAALQRTDSLVAELCNEKQSHAKTRSRLQEELSAARKSRKDVETRLQHYESMHKQTTLQLEHQVSTARKQVESMQGKLQDCDDKLSQIRLQEEKIRSLEMQLEQTNSFNANKNSEVQLLRSQLEREVQGNRSAMENLESMYKNQLMQMEDAYKQLQDKCESLKDSKADLTCELDNLQDKYQQAGLHMSEQQQRLQHSAEQEINRLNTKLEHQKDEYQEQMDNQIQQLRAKLQGECSEWQQKCDQFAASYHKVKELKRQAESDSIRYKDAAESYRSRCESKSEQLLGMERDVEMYRSKVHDLEHRYRETDVQLGALQKQLMEEETAHKKLANQMRSVEAQLDLANRQLRGQDDLRKTVSASTINNKGRRETTFDAKFGDDMETDAPLDLNDLRHPRSPGTRRRSRLPRSPSVPAKLDSGRLTREQRAPSTFSLASSNDSVIVDTDSHETLAHHAARMKSGSVSQSVLTRSRASVVGLPGYNSQSSLPLPGYVHDHHAQNQMPRSFRGMFDMNEDEPEQLESGRLPELQRRNTLCLPHLKSAYPVETQTRNPTEISDDNLRVGEAMSEHQEERRQRRKRPSSEGVPLDDSLEGSAKRRTRSQGLDDSLEASAGKRKNGDKIFKMSTPGVKLYKHYSPKRPSMRESHIDEDQPLGSYQRPGPPTPGVTPGVTRGTPHRLRSRNTPSPVISTKKKMRTNRKFTPLRKKSNTNENLNAQGKVPKESMMFNIGFTPKKSRRLLGKRQEESQKKKPLVDNNRVQKGF